MRVIVENDGARGEASVDAVSATDAAMLFFRAAVAAGFHWENMAEAMREAADELLPEQETDHGTAG